MTNGHEASSLKTVHISFISMSTVASSFTLVVHRDMPVLA